MVGCIDIGSNTTRLLVATVERGRLRERHAVRVFTEIGAAVDSAGRIPAEKVAEVASVARTLCSTASEHGTDALAVVATGAVRRAPNGEELTAAVRAACGHEVRVLSGAEEAALSFAGACHVSGAAGGSLAVVDVGGGSTEIAVGPPGAGMEWSASADVGSASLRRAHLAGDPPDYDELEAAAGAARAALGALRPPPASGAAAVGGTATALGALTGRALTPSTLDALCARVCTAPASAAAAELGLPVERVRLLPAGLVILRAAAEVLGTPLGVVRGGLREGVALELEARR